MITEAIKSAQTEHVVYFLLTAYIETLGHTDSSGIPTTVRRLPLRDKNDVRERLRLVRVKLYTRRRDDKRAKPVMEKTAEVLNTAVEQLEVV